MNLINTDIDECSIANGGCQHVCINQPGTYSCDCFNGYQLTENNNHCAPTDDDGPNIVYMPSKFACIHMDLLPL